MSQQWYLIHAKPRQEYKAKEHLERQQFEAYLPVITVMNRQEQGQQVKKVEPLFPRYLFVLLDDTKQNWAPIRSTRGVQALVRFGGVPAVVPMGLVESIQAQENRMADQNLTQSFVPGETVSIAEGPFSGLEAIFLAENGQERVTILLNIVGQPTSVRVKRSSLDALQKN